jgi:hypothetical protein
MKKALFASMWKLAMEGNVTSQIWLSKNLFGWKDKADISISGPKPLIIERSDGKEIILTARNQIEEKAS